VDFPTNAGSQNAPPPLLKLGTARIRTLGPESDRFVEYLSRHYGVRVGAAKMISSVDASAVGLGDDGGSTRTGKKDMKFFFFDDGPDSRYAEVYVDIDFDSRVLEFHEKDPEYRKPLVLALTQAP
jgi:hypothetical protein